MGKHKVWPFNVLQRDLLITLAGSSEYGDQPAWVAEISEGNDTGYLPIDGAAWQVHSHVATIIGGIRALLMQALHPGAMAGVAEHSNYESDAIGRLNGTIRWMMTVTFGDTVRAERVCEYVKRLHVPVVGEYRGPDGTMHPYAANDPTLSRWVHTAFADSFIATHLAYGSSEDSAKPDFADTYLAEWAIAGTLMNVEKPPVTRAEMDANIDELTRSGVLRCDERTLRVVEFLRRPPLEPSLRLGYQLLFRAAVATLRPEHQRMLGLKLHGGWVFRVFTPPVMRSIRWLLGSENASMHNARERHARVAASQEQLK